MMEGFRESGLLLSEWIKLKREHEQHRTDKDVNIQNVQIHLILLTTYMARGMPFLRRRHQLVKEFEDGALVSFSRSRGGRLLAALQSCLTKHNLVIIDKKWIYCRSRQPRNNTGSWMGPHGDRRQSAVRTIMEKTCLAIVAVTNRGFHYLSLLERGETIESSNEVNIFSVHQSSATLRDDREPSVSSAEMAPKTHYKIRLGQVVESNLAANKHSSEPSLQAAHLNQDQAAYRRTMRVISNSNWHHGTSNTQKIVSNSSSPVRNAGMTKPGSQMYFQNRAQMTANASYAINSMRLKPLHHTSSHVIRSKSHDDAEVKQNSTILKKQPLPEVSRIVHHEVQETMTKTTISNNEAVVNKEKKKPKKKKTETETEKEKDTTKSIKIEETENVVLITAREANDERKIKSTVEEIVIEDNIQSTHIDKTNAINEEKIVKEDVAIVEKEQSKKVTQQNNKEKNVKKEKNIEVKKEEETKTETTVEKKEVKERKEKKQEETKTETIVEKKEVKERKEKKKVSESTNTVIAASTAAAVTVVSENVAKSQSQNEESKIVEKKAETINEQIEESKTTNEPVNETHSSASKTNSESKKEKKKKTAKSKIESDVISNVVIAESVVQSAETNISEVNKENVNENNETMEKSNQKEDKTEDKKSSENNTEKVASVAAAAAVVEEETVVNSSKENKSDESKQSEVKDTNIIKNSTNQENKKEDTSNEVQNKEEKNISKKEDTSSETVSTVAAVAVVSENVANSSPQNEESKPDEKKAEASDKKELNVEDKKLEETIMNKSESTKSEDVKKDIPKTSEEKKAESPKKEERKSTPIPEAESPQNSKKSDEKSSSENPKEREKKPVSKPEKESPPKAPEAKPEDELAGVINSLENKLTNDLKELSGQQAPSKDGTSDSSLNKFLSKEFQDEVDKFLTSDNYEGDLLSKATKLGK